MKSVFVSLLAIGLCTMSAVTASADEWTQIGKEKLKDESGETSFRIGVEDGRYRMIKFRAEGGDVDIDEATIEFTIGDPQTVDRLGTIRDGKESRAINVGLVKKSSIKRISVKYKTSGGDKMDLLVLAKKK